MLWYNKEATCFAEALPIGNGSMGCMVYGGSTREKLSLNHDSFWSGVPYEEKDEGVYELFSQARSLLDEGKAVEAQATLDSLINTSTATYLAGLNMFIDFDSEGVVSQYKRRLDLDCAIATTEYAVGGNKIHQEVFATHPDGLIAIKLSSEDDRGFTITYDSIHPIERHSESGLLSATVQAPIYTAPAFDSTDQPNIYDNKDSNRSCLLYANCRVDSDGNVTADKTSLTVRDAKETVIYIKLSCSFVSFAVYPLQSKDARIMRELAFDTDMEYQQIKERHMADYRSLNSRSSLKLGESRYDTLPTDDRVLLQEKLHDDVGLIALMWKYAKYLTISCSRNGTQASNLQGIWSEEARPPWSSAYTININIQMNYWLCETVNLSECHLPFFALMKNLYQNGSKTAQRFYHCGGWCVHHKTDIWAHTKPTGARAIHGFWPMSAIWCCAHIWEHYCYTLDKVFLREHLPMIQSAVCFVLDWLQLGEDGLLHSYPSSSPENSYNIDGNRISVHYDSAMDIALIKEIFDICIKSENILGVDTYSAQIEKVVNRIPSYKEGSKGQLLEWGEELEETDPAHRHISLLYGLYPSSSIKTCDFELIDACIRTMELRGNKSTGWGMAWRINIWARLRKAEYALETMKNMLYLIRGNSASQEKEHGLFPNLLNGYPFQIDANFGYAAGINEMLIQSHLGIIDILPSVPTEWRDGEFKGFVVRGGSVVDCRWNSTEAVCKIRFASEGDYRITCFGREKNYTAKQDEQVEIIFIR